MKTQVISSKKRHQNEIYSLILYSYLLHGIVIENIFIYVFDKELPGCNNDFHKVSKC